MGEPKRLNRLYDVPRMKWNKQKIKADNKIINDYGLKRKKEIWKAETMVRNYRKKARLLLAGRVDDYATRKDELLNRLIRLGIFTKDHKIEDVLKISANDVLDRRLQTLVFRKGLSLTPTQARQLITHGHILVNGKIRKTPSSLIYKDDSISYSNTKIKNEIEKSIETKGKSFVPKEDKSKVDLDSKKEETKEVKE
ncbi:MAG: 30S ribosomal protein S4 [Candidatus ainarchaeum sp.]|nr:30S ribosomal protein S4 [Candidatus ainarchaeum sp.]MDD3975774.1 30S ribosomal protein S4 [Candidatus ainarchaeum sp.]